MIRLIGYELKKLFLKKTIFGAILVFSIINILKINSVYCQDSLLSDKNAPEWKTVYWEIYDDFKGKMTNEKIEKLLKIYTPLEEQVADRTASTRTDNPNTYTGNIYSDYLLFRWCFIQPMEYMYMYRNTANDIVKKAYENLEFYKGIGNSFEYRKNAIIINLFTGRKISEFEYFEMYQSYLHYDFSILLVLLICLFGITNVFVNEKETKMYDLLLTTPHGGKNTTTAKIIASSVFIVGVSLWFFLLDSITFIISFKTLEGSSLPVYAVQNFMASPIKVKLWEFSIISCVFKIIGMLTFGLLFMVISGFFEHALFPFVINLILATMLVFWGEKSLGSGYILKKILNPYILLVNRELFGKTEFVNFFGIPVLSYVSIIIYTAFLFFAFILLIYLSAGKNEITKRRREFHADNTI